MVLTEQRVRLIVKNMIGEYSRSGGSSINIGGVSQGWVKQNFVTKDFFSSLFTAIDEDDEAIETNDTETDVASIKANAGLWTEQFLSCLGLSSGGGGGSGGSSTLKDLYDVELNGLSTNDLLQYNGTKWENVPMDSITPTLQTLTFSAGSFSPTSYNPAVSKTVNIPTTTSHISEGNNLYYTDTRVEEKVTKAYVDALGISASSLKTSCNFWGHTYNGTQTSINGDMSSVGNISFSASGKNIGGTIYFDTTYNRIGIGQTSPQYKLDVSGSARVSSLIIGNATISWDSTNGCLKVDKGFYSTDFISALGVSSMNSDDYASLENRVAAIEQLLNIS